MGLVRLPRRLRELLDERAKGTLGAHEQIELAELLIEAGDVDVGADQGDAPPSYLVETNVIEPHTIKVATPMPPTTEPLTTDLASSARTIVDPASFPKPSIKQTFPMEERPKARMKTALIDPSRPPPPPAVLPVARVTKTPRPTLTGQLLDGKYKVGRVLGEGGFGVVYEGTHTLLDERVAIKCMRGEVADAREYELDVAQFLREARVLFALAHPGIVRLYDLGKLKVDGIDLPYVVLERVDGISLALEIAKREREKRHFTVAEISELAEELLAALAFAHESGVAHRDLKPSNILIAHPHQRAQGFRAKLVDFGIARWLDEMHRVGSMSAYSPAYAAPEQATPGEVTGTRVDIFAVAIVLTEICTLRPVVVANTPAELLESLKGKRTIDITSRRSDLPAALETALRRAVSIDPEDRHATARELLEDVRRALGTRPPMSKARPALPLAPPPRPIEDDEEEEKTEVDREARIGRYELGPLLATGGMGKVNLAVLRGADGFSKVVVAKRILADRMGEGDALLAFRDEARIASRIVHANVVQLLDVVEAKKELALVFEYILGATLREIPVPPPLAVVSSIMAGALRGLHAAHVATAPDGQPLGLVHRDVAPANIIVGADGLARVLDFGVARANRRRAVTERHVVKGRLGYMAPEQLQGEPATPRADIHAAGVVLWELCTGQRLFDGPDDVAVVAARTASYLPPSPLLHREDLPAPLVVCIMQAIAPRPEDRFATAAEMATALEAATAPASAGQVAEWLSAECSELLRRRATERGAVEAIHRIPSMVDSEAEAPPVRAVVPAAAKATVVMAPPPPVAVSVVPQLAPIASPVVVQNRRPLLAGLAVALGFVAVISLGLVFWLVRASRAARASADADAATASESVPSSPSSATSPDPSALAAGGASGAGSVQSARMPPRPPPHDPKHGGTHH